uniref:AIG1-type G domain-containing protein n=1 Tax=Cyclopterus lumpus TaxID=8103 RepID=A0A8C3AT27_CYCLU
MMCHVATACEASLPASEAEPLRIVLLGRTGTGRSSSGNTILGRSAFWVSVSPCSVTTECNRQTGTVHGRSISVIDTPGFLHTHLSPEEVMAGVGQSVALSSPGPHAFLVTLQPGRLTQEERDALEWIKATFGPGATRFTTVLFTWGDQLRGKRIEDFLGESNELSEFVSGCHGGYHVFDNSEQGKTTECAQQVVHLLKKVDRTVASNGGGCYSNEMFKEAERAIREARKRILGERGHKAESPKKVAQNKEEQRPELGRRREEEERRRRKEEEARKRVERLFWCELVTASFFFDIVYLNHVISVLQQHNAPALYNHTVD